MYLTKKLSMLFLVVVLVLPGVLSPLHVRAQGRSAVDTPLLGAGASDEINIIKIMDMALNKAGLSMSPAKIPQFVEYWWACVKSDLQILISDAGTTITTVSDFVDYVASAAADPAAHDGLKMVQITLKFARFCATQEIKTLDDYKNLLIKDNMFRMFLMSFLTDQETNLVPGNGINKGGRYKLASDFVKMVRQAAESFIEEYEGYYLVNTLKPADILATFFQYKQQYDSLVASAKTMSGDMVLICSRYYNRICVDLLDGVSFVDSNSPPTDSYGNLFFKCYDSSWQSVLIKKHWFYDDFTAIDFSGVWEFPESSYKGGESYGYFVDTLSNKIFSDESTTLKHFIPITVDGRAIKVWKSLDGLKNYSVGKSDIYYTNAYSSFDNSVDNSIEFTGAYYSSTNTNYSHQNIQNTIDNSQETINESTVNNIVNNYITNVTNNYNSSGSGSGEGSGGGWNLGEGIEAFIKGVAELLDFVLKLLGELIGLLATFATSVLDVLKSLAVVGTSFGDFLKAVFGFLPDECISLIMSSIGAMCLVGIIKVFKK